MLYLGAVGDRHGRKLMLSLGISSRYRLHPGGVAPSSRRARSRARILGGVSAGMAFPTTLALITALWAGPARTRSIALWSASAAPSHRSDRWSPGALLENYWWGSVFLITLPLAGVALVLAALGSSLHT